MLTALFLLAVSFGLVQELKVPAKWRVVPFNYRGRKQASKRSALVTVPGKTKS
jgi:hypothetical protein